MCSTHSSELAQVGRPRSCHGVNYKAGAIPTLHIPSTLSIPMHYFAGRADSVNSSSALHCCSQTAHLDLYTFTPQLPSVLSSHHPAGEAACSTSTLFSVPTLVWRNIHMRNHKYSCGNCQYPKQPSINRSDNPCCASVFNRLALGGS